MKKIIMRISILAVLSSCSNDNNNNNNNNNPIIEVPVPITSENTWKLADYTYTKAVSNQQLSAYTNGNPFTLININSNIVSLNGIYVASSLDIAFNTNTIGTYTIKSAATSGAESLLKYMDIQCSISNSSGKTAIYKSTDTNINATITEVDGKFVVNIPNEVVLQRTFVNGLVDAPQTFTFRCNKVR